MSRSLKTKPLTKGVPKDGTFDVVVIGSGAAGMSAAIAAADGGGSVVLLEKSPYYGGTTATSGGGTWIPNNHLMLNMGLSDNADDALAYLRHLVGNEVDEERIRAYINQAPRVIDYFEKKTNVQFSSTAYPDYYPEIEGGKMRGRTLQPRPFRSTRLKKDFAQLAPAHRQTLMMKRIQMTMEEARSLMLRQKHWRWITMRIVLSYWFDLVGRLKSKRDRRLTLGVALIARLRASLKQRDVELWLNTSMDRLEVEDNRAVGIIAHHKEQTIHLKARRAIVLTAGGFERNQEMRTQYHPQPSKTDWSVAHPDNKGEVLKAALAHNAACDLMDAAWWTPVVCVPGRDKAQALFIERALPGFLIVNRAGKRFVKEAAPYLDVGQAMYDTGAIPAFVIFDSVFRKNYPCGPLLPSSIQPDHILSKTLKKFIKKADSLSALATQLDIDPQALEQTATKMNHSAMTGQDLELHNGESGYDRYYGDPSHKPNPCLGKVARPPFYGFEIYPGDIGTKGGLLTNAHGQVLHRSGDVIEGLYAAGNISASVMGRSYPGAGATIGPALVFGFLAGEHSMRQTNNGTP